MLTRAEMIKVINVDHGSVMYNGVVIDKVEDLPSEAELAKGDPAREAQAKETLLKKKAEIDEQLESLEVSQPADNANAESKKEDIKKEDVKKK